MAHERATGIGTSRGEVNVYGPGTGRFPEPLPLIYGFERPAYPSVAEAEQAANMRSVLNTVPGTRVSLSDYLRTNPDAATLAELLRANPRVGPRRQRAPQPGAPPIPRQRPFTMEDRLREQEMFANTFGNTEADYANTPGMDPFDLTQFWQLMREADPGAVMREGEMGQLAQQMMSLRDLLGGR